MAEISGTPTPCSCVKHLLHPPVAPAIVRIGLEPLDVKRRVAVARAPPPGPGNV